MPARVIALCLALLLFWSGLESPGAQAQAGPPVSGDVVVLALQLGDEHPAQALNETVADLQALVTQPALHRGCIAAASAAWAWASNALPAPVLDGPRRPPRTTPINA